jgi:hypothetical protein
MQRIENQIQSLNVLGEVYTTICPSVENWPFCVIPSMSSFNNITNSLITIGYVGGIGLAPIVKPDQVSLFENKTIAYYNLKGYSDIVGK